MKSALKKINIFSRQVFVVIFFMLALIGFSAKSSEHPLAYSQYYQTADSLDRVEKNRESLFPDKQLSLSGSHFTWGAEVGASVDMDGNNLSTFDLDAVLGYKNKYLKIVGVGAGIHRALGSGNMFIPVYALIRTSFRQKPSLFFLNFRTGYSFNTIGDSPIFGDFSTAAGLGINLAMSRKFQSHIIISYVYRHFSSRNQDVARLSINNSNLAQISFGVNF